MTKMGKKKKKGLVAALCVIAVIVLLAAAYGIFCLIIEDDKIWADASVNGVNIQGMSKKEAAQTVEQKFEEDYKDTAVTVELDGQQYTMNVFPMLGMDASAEIEKAYEKGHGNLLVRGLEWVEMKRGKAEKLSYDVQPTVAHPDEVEGIVQASGIQDYNSMQDTTYEVTDTGLIVIVLLAAAYGIFCLIIEDDKIWADASVNGVNIQGMSKKEAAQTVEQKFEEDYKDTAVTVELDGQQYTMNVFPMLGMDASAEIEKAYEKGHGNLLVRGLEWVEMKRGKAEKLSYDVQPTVAHPDEVEGIVQASGIQDYNSMQDTTYEVTDTGLIVHKGIAGTRPDVDALKQQIQTNVTAMNFQDVISCPTAENQLTEPDFAGIASQIYTEPVNATLDPDNGYSVVASKNGTSMDADSAKAEYESAEENTDITIPFTFTEPEITTEKMNANLFKDTLGSYSSSAAGGTSGRIHNVGLTASICNGQIVLPGETFSFNGVVGDTTAEKGYQEAAGYQDGKVVQVLGGGECQVSSTLFSAILYTDLDVLERANHSMPVHYVPSGMDATVFWDSPDFKFENNHKYPVKIVMNMDSSDTLTVKILGTKENDYTIEPRVEQIDEMSNVTYRDYKDASGNVVKSESVCASKYKPLNSGS